MAWIGGADGIFRLRDSDAWCGSQVSVDDAADILGVKPADLAHVRQRPGPGGPFIVELDLHKAWSSGKVPASPLLPTVGNAKVSLDEIVLKRLIEITLPGAVVDQQVKFGRKHADLRATLNGSVRFVEFVGPSHFIAGQYQRDPVSPLERKKAVEDHFGSECVIWPYWIQRCSLNVRALFDRDVRGLAAVWSTKAFFGDFVYPDSAAIVTTLTDRFGAMRADGIGYMYGSTETPNKPEHPVVEKLKKGKVAEERLIPPGSTVPKEWWLPK